MKRLAKLIPKDPIAPEWAYLVCTPHGAVVWNGTIGVRYAYGRIGKAVGELVKEHGTFAILDALTYYRTAHSLERKAEKVELNARSGTLRVTMSDRKGKIDLPIRKTLPAHLPHLRLDWIELGDDIDADSARIDTIWFDAPELITRDGANIWGEIIGVYDAPEWAASFDQGVLLYRNKTGHNKESALDVDDVYFCPSSVLALGFEGLEWAVFYRGRLYLVGPEVAYFTQPIVETRILQSMLTIRDRAVRGGSWWEASPDFNPGLWKRARLLGGGNLRLVIAARELVLKGERWEETIGKTLAPDGVFSTTLSLIERWVTKTEKHQIIVADGGWILSGTTARGCEFYGSLTDAEERGGSQDNDEGELLAF